MGGLSLEHQVLVLERDLVLASALGLDMDPVQRMDLVQDMEPVLEMGLGSVLDRARNMAMVLDTG